MRDSVMLKYFVDSEFLVLKNAKLKPDLQKMLKNIKTIYITL